MSNISERLEKLNSEFASTEASVGGFSNPADGKYIFSVNSAVVQENKKNNKLQVYYVFKIEEGDEDYIGREVREWDLLEATDTQPDAVKYTKGRMERLGLETGDMDISDLPDALESLVGVRFEGQLKSKGGFQNTYCNEVIDD